MESRDSIGRKRHPQQNRGLRPLFPKLPMSYESRPVRIAMTTPAWNLVDSLMAERAQATRPRALGEIIEALLARPGPGWPNRGRSRFIRESRNRAAASIGRPGRFRRNAPCCQPRM